MANERLYSAGYTTHWLPPSPARLLLAYACGQEIMSCDTKQNWVRVRLNEVTCPGCQEALVQSRLEKP